MVGSKLDQEIISIYNRDITALKSINQISHILNKSYPNINYKVNSLISKGILNKKEIGRSYLCSINLDSDKAVLLLSLNEVSKRDRKIKKLGKNFIEDIKTIRSEFDIYTIILKKNKLFFVLDHIHDQEAIKNLFPKLNRFELIFLTKKEFKQYLIQNKDFLQRATVLCCYESYYELLSEVYNRMMALRLSQ